MSGRNVDFGDRLATAAAARQALLDKARAKANDPELAKRQAERAAIAADRDYLGTMTPFRKAGAA